MHALADRFRGIDVTIFNFPISRGHVGREFFDLADGIFDPLGGLTASICPKRQLFVNKAFEIIASIPYISQIVLKF